jgi:hypothetical protein
LSCFRACHLFCRSVTSAHAAPSSVVAGRKRAVQKLKKRTR